ncbi:nitroreductase family protein [Pelosinus propionicus]|uniref:Nitroreductase n=1 Tax=Pelosinus propionicus DSM 13327 TaxID=1123291 RepID=A0A1I4H2X1_9FIRM|nr:nitroreductase family protein [Pelosinus propionicus]SFL35756.1 Nitroreductase [Pelosinus propionicus DSM 13327]
MDIKQAILDRRSIRSYQDQSIPREIIEELLELAVKAPSGKNRQPWRFVVLESQKKDRLATIMADKSQSRKQQNLDIGSCETSIAAIQQASIVILVFNAFSTIEKDYNHYRLLTDTQSIGAAIQTMILAAQDFGLGTLWICDIFYSEREICSWLERNDELVGAVAIGYPNQSPYARPRKSWSEVTEWLR